MIANPLLPVLRDHLAHHYWKESHFRIVHKHHGDAHVHNELKETGDIQKEQNTGKVKVEISEYHCILVPPFSYYRFAMTSIAPVCFFLVSCLKGYSKPLYQPPRVTAA